MTDAATPRRSDATRAAILTAARARFAADGYERATIRAIASDAGIDPAMVMRYYGNKEKLFAAAADFDLRLPDLTGLPAADYGRTLARHFVRRWEADDTFLALLRAGVSNEPARDRMRQIFADQIGPLAAAVSPAGEAPTRAGLVASQILGMAFCRYALRLPPLAAMSADELVGWLAPTLQRYLTAPAQG
jgi:AcrR family transcriptional regulator